MTLQYLQEDGKKVHCMVTLILFFDTQNTDFRLKTIHI
jgi:hypothetical protein